MFLEALYSHILYFLHQFILCMKNIQKQTFPLRRFNSMSEDTLQVHTRTRNLLTSDKNQDSEQTQPMSNPKLCKISTFVNAPRNYLKKINEFEENTGSDKKRSNIVRMKHPRVAESFDEFSENDSQNSEVLFVGSRDLPQKKPHEVHLSKSSHFDDLGQKYKKEEEQKSHKKDLNGYVPVEEYHALQQKEKDLQARNKKLQQQNQQLKKRVAQLQESPVKSPCRKMEAPKFIKNREARKDMKSAQNLTFAHSSFGRTFKQNSDQTTYLRNKLISQSKNNENSIRATFSTGKQLQRTLEKIREEYHKKKQQLNQKVARQLEI